MKDLNVTVVQSDLVWANIDGNLKRFSSWLNAYDGESDLIIFPEMFTTGFALADITCAEETNGKAFEWMHDIAVNKNAVVVGSIFVKEKTNFYNRLIWMPPDGNYSFYDKRHLFRLAGEHKQFSKGKSKIICKIGDWKILPLICYDLRFPVWSKNNLKDNEYEYDCLIYIANWPARRNFAWNSLLVARAIENLSFVIGVNRIGLDGNNIAHQGDSVVFNYRGRTMYKCKSDKNEIKTIVLKKDELNLFRKDFGAGNDWDNFKLVV